MPFHVFVHVLQCVLVNSLKSLLSFILYFFHRCIQLTIQNLSGVALKISHMMSNLAGAEARESVPLSLPSCLEAFGLRTEIQEQHDEEGQHPVER